MRIIFVVIIFVLLLLLISALSVVGLCIGIAYLMIYFIPTISLVNTLVPAAILATVLIIMIGSAFKALVIQGIKNTIMPSDYDDEEYDDEPEPPPVINIKSYSVKKNGRWNK
jgi:hypothetical protein